MTFSALFRLERTRTGSPVSSIVGNVGEQLLEEHPAFEPREVHAEAEVFGDPERQVRVRVRRMSNACGSSNTSSSRFADV